MVSLIRNHLISRVKETLSHSKPVPEALSNLNELVSFGKHVPGKYVEFHLPGKKFTRGDVSKLLDISGDSIIQSIQKKKIGTEELISISVYYNPLAKAVLLEKCIPRTSSKNGKKVVVEFSSPNIAKPFHMGHLRSTVLGNFVANLQELSEDVVRMNYLGDWGTQMGYIQLGLEKSGKNLSDIKDDPIKAICDAYVMANSDTSLQSKAKEVFSAIERQEDPKGFDQWLKIRKITETYLKETYNRLGVKFDEYSWESNFSRTNVEPLMKQLKEAGLTKKVDGHTKISVRGMEAVLLKSDNSTLYITRDIASALDRIEKYKCERSIYVVDKSQSEHLKLLRATISKLLKKDVVEHVAFGRIVGMSTRKGSSIFLSDILDEAIAKMAVQQSLSPNTRASDPETTTVLGLSALLVYILKQRRMRDFKFDWDLALQGTGDSGVKLQYTHCRLTSLQKQCPVDIPSVCLPELLKEPVTVQLVMELARYDDVLRFCRKEMESSALIIYLFKLCNTVSKALTVLPVNSAEKELAEQRILLFSKAKEILARGMRVLGMTPLEKM